MADSVQNKLVGVLLAICLALASFSLKFSFDVNADVRSMRDTAVLQFQTIQEDLDELKNDKEKDIEQDKMLRKFWKIHSATKEAINDDRAKESKDLFKWPDLD